MKLDKLYKKVIAIGIANDSREKKAIQKILDEEKEKYKNLKKDDIDYYDKDRLFNPFSDTRILNGNTNMDIKKIMVGIDIGVGELVLAYILNRDLGRKIDLIISHHPEGHALAQLYDVMKLQADILADLGIPVSVAQQLMDQRIDKIERRLLPVNHTRTVDGARTLDLPFMCIHTAADNCVTKFLQKKLDKESPSKLKDLVANLKNIPEYQKSARLQAPPKIINGSENNKCGKIHVEMTGGTEGAKEIAEKFSAAGISTLVGMHFSEEYLDNAKKANLNIVIAGHISSDTLGLNLLFDEVEKEEKLEFINIAGFERIRRSS